jgi:hypothetical protein
MQTPILRTLKNVKNKTYLAEQMLEEKPEIKILGKKLPLSLKFRFH